MTFLNESDIDTVNLSKDNKLERIHLRLALRQNYAWVHWGFSLAWAVKPQSYSGTLSLLMLLLGFLYCDISYLDFSWLQPQYLNFDDNILPLALSKQIQCSQQHCSWRCIQTFLTANCLKTYIEFLGELLISTLVYGKTKIFKKIYIITFSF